MDALAAEPRKLTLRVRKSGHFDGHGHPGQPMTSEDTVMVELEMLLQAVCIFTG